jgi:dihydropteroate synthase
LEVHPSWHAGRFLIDLRSPKIMGIVNVTPDSFSDGGQFDAPKAAMSRCEELVRDGADLLDIGGESTRPGASMPSWREELARLEPVVRHAVTLGVPVSVDTSRPEVIMEMLGLGVDIINDVRALRRPGAIAALSQSSTAGLCLMHMEGEPGTMQADPCYDDVASEVRHFLQTRVAAALSAGIHSRRIILDPGFGFGKLHQHNFTLCKAQDQLLSLGFPLLVGWSRKSTLGHVTGRAVGERAVASVAAALASLLRGASVFRVHDVRATVDAFRIWRAFGLVE